MTKGIRVSMILAVCAGALAGCGRSSDMYVNLKDANQTLELTTAKAPLKQVVRGSFEAPFGEFVMGKDREVSSGRYSKVENAYVLFLDQSGSRKMKFEMQSDSSLRDENGDVWQHRTHSRMLRAQ